MKSINIFFALIITLAFASCSSEGDILNEMNNSNSSVIEGEKSEISVLIKDGSEADRQISNFIAVAFNGETRVAYVKGINASEEIKITGLKANTTVDVYVVANAGNQFDNISAKSDFLTQTTTLSQTTTELVKFGRAENIALQSGKNELANAINLEQVAARVDLSIETINCKSFTVKSVKLANAHSKSSIFGNKNEYDVYTTTEDGKIADSANGTISEIATLYTFANNNSAKQTTLIIEGEIVHNNGTTDNRTYNVVVNNGEIVNGYVYQIKAKINPNMDITVNYQVVNWNSVTVDVPSFE